MLSFALSLFEVQRVAVVVGQQRDIGGRSRRKSDAGGRVIIG